MIEKIEDYSQFQSLILQQYRDANKLKSIILSDMQQANDLEDALFELRDKFWLSTAEGDQLDIIGRIHDQPRLGMNDDDYRSMIGIKIAINQGSGEPETIINAIRNLYNANVVFLQFPGDATIQIFTDVIFTEDQKDLLLRIISAGTQLLTIIFNEFIPFGFENDPNALGFALVLFEELELNNGNILELNNGIMLELNTQTPDNEDINAGGLSAAVLL